MSVPPQQFLGVANTFRKDDPLVYASQTFANVIDKRMHGGFEPNIPQDTVIVQMFNSFKAGKRFLNDYLNDWAEHQSGFQAFIKALYQQVDSVWSQTPCNSVCNNMTCYDKVIVIYHVYLLVVCRFYCYVLTDEDTRKKYSNVLELEDFVVSIASRIYRVPVSARILATLAPHFKDVEIAPGDSVVSSICTLVLGWINLSST